MELISSLLLIGIVLLVTLLHELGHFIFARMLDVPVSTFAIGFGPNLISYEDKKKTNWNINLIPLGGYISISQQGENETDSMLSIPPIKRLIVAFGGPLANLITFFLIGSIFYNKVGIKGESVFYEQEKYVIYQSSEEYIIFNESQNKKEIVKTLPLNLKLKNKIGYEKISLKNSFYFCSYQLFKNTKYLIETFSSFEKMKETRSIIIAQKGIQKKLKEENSQSIFVIFLYYVVIFSLSIGLFNLLPFFGLDGSWILISFINIFFKFKKEGERKLMLIFNYGSFFLFFLFGLLLFRDLLNIFLEFFS